MRPDRKRQFRWTVPPRRSQPASVCRCGRRRACGGPLHRAPQAETAGANAGAGTVAYLRPNRRKPQRERPAREKTTVKRRTFIVSAAAAAAMPLARPAIGANPKTLIFVPQANLTSLDPVWTTATVTRNFSLMVYETLYRPRPVVQPAAADGRRPHHRRRRPPLDDEAARGPGIPRRHAGAGARLRRLAAALAPSATRSARHSAHASMRSRRPTIERWCGG